MNTRHVVRRWAAELRDLSAEARSHRLGGEAARIAYYGFLSFFPAILLVFAVTGSVGGDVAFDRFVVWLHAALPGVASESLQRFIAGVRQTPQPGLISAGAALLLWSASGAFGALTLVLNATFGSGRPRSWWRRQALTLLVVAVGAAGLAFGLAAQVAGPELLSELGLGRFSAAWSLLRGPAVFTVLTIVMYLLYAVLPNVSFPRPWWTLLVGAAAGTALWMAATFLFRLSLRALARYGSAYGVMSGVVALQVWLYLTALGVLLGAEIAAALVRRLVPGVRAGGAES